ncbi:hypothetical protein CGCVW01_v001574 [Colletotrichum viniferum]|nr:hypothetical protein CGCVW01_v001574 [Colletotrichum viniferum]
MGRASRCRTFHSAPLAEDLGGNLAGGRPRARLASCSITSVPAGCHRHDGTTRQHHRQSTRQVQQENRRPCGFLPDPASGSQATPKHRPSCILVSRQPGRPGHINSLGEGREAENLVYFCRVLSFSSPSLAAGDTPLSSGVRAVADATRCQMPDALEPQDGRPSRPSASVPSLSRQRRCRGHLRQPCCHRAASASRRLRAEATTSPSQCLSSAALTTAEPDTHARTHTHTHSTNARPDRTSKPITVPLSML